MFLRSTKKYNNDVFLQEPIGVDKEGNEVTLEDKLADDNYPVDEQVDLKMKTQTLHEVIKKVLKVRERKIIELRYGLVTGEEVTQRAIAEMMGISRSYVYDIAYCKYNSFYNLKNQLYEKHTKLIDKHKNIIKIVIVVYI